MNLPYDYSRCGASSCTVKAQCARHTSPGRPDGWQVCSDFSMWSIAGPCSYFIAQESHSTQHRRRSVSDLTQRLRDSAEQWLTEVDTRLEAADRIEQLEAALKEIQRHAEMMRVWSGMEWRYHPIHAKRIFDRASAALGATSERIADESEREKAQVDIKDQP